MSYISDYEHGGDPFEYEQCCAAENNTDRIDREEYDQDRKECCNNCKYLYPLEEFIPQQGEEEPHWEYSNVCLAFPLTEEKEEHNFAMVVRHPDVGMCEMFKEEV